jgi:peptidoglycan/LPS O-acetylase OafA/YrhL
VNLAIIFALQVAVLGVAASDLLPNLFASMLYSHNLWYGEHSRVNGVAWSLEVEWQFYLLAPLLFAVILRPPRGQLLIWLLILIGGAAHAVSPWLDSRVGLSLLHYFGFFLAGVSVALADIAPGNNRQASLPYDLLIVSAGLAIISILLIDRRTPMALLPALTALFIFGGLRGRYATRILGWWPIYIVGGMCYTIYLYHFFVISAVGRVVAPLLPVSGGSALSLMLLALIVAPLVVAFCAIPYLSIERPFMIWRPGKTRLVSSFRWPR